LLVYHLRKRLKTIDQFGGNNTMVNTDGIRGLIQDQLDAKLGVPNTRIKEVFENLHDLLQYKNARYGNSGLEPIKVFSKVDAETGLLQRLDDKIARIKNSSELRKNDVADVVGYLVLICVKKGWTNFDEFKD
jgi:hypothetical protein